VDGKPRAHPRAQLAVQHHAALLQLEGSLLGHDGQFSPAAEQGQIALAELGGRAARDQIDKGPFLELAQAIRWPQSPIFDANRRDFRGFVGWPTHPGTPERPSFGRFELQVVVFRASLRPFWW
jgi:hypothetical protein